MKKQTDFETALKKIFLLIARNYIIFIKYKMLHQKNRIRDFNQKLYTFIFKLKLYLSDRALNYMSS